MHSTHQHFQHNQHTLCEKFYYVATSFDPELPHHQAMIQEYESIQKLNSVNGRSATFTLKIQ